MSFDDQGRNEKLVATQIDKIRKRNVKDVINQSFELVLAKSKVPVDNISYIATTGEGELVNFRRGHFYSMTTHSRGALFLNSDTRAVVDIGALHSKALIIDERSKVLRQQMSSQCAAGSGQFLENISRYLGVSVEDIGQLSLQADNPEQVSGICAVLAETDVINMVSRGISAPNILKGIHISIGKRLINLLRMIKAEGTVFITGGMANDKGFIQVMQDLANKANLEVKIMVHENSVHAGAIGAAIWGAFRHVRLIDQ